LKETLSLYKIKLFLNRKEKTLKCICIPYNYIIGMCVAGSWDGLSGHEDHKRTMGNVPAGSYIHSYKKMHPHGITEAS